MGSSSYKNESALPGNGERLANRDTFKTAHLCTNSTDLISTVALSGQTAS
jgi:hypothetical protein